MQIKKPCDSRSGLKRGVYVHPTYEPQSPYHNLKFQLDTKCASGKPLVVHCTSDPDELETCNLLQNPPKTSINSLQLKLRRPTNNQKELKVSLGHDRTGEGATINNVNKYILQAISLQYLYELTCTSNF